MERGEDGLLAQDSVCSFLFIEEKNTIEEAS